MLLPVLLLGFVAYGLSIFTYVRAQKTLGAVKTSAFYAIAPFAGAVLSFVGRRGPVTGNIGGGRCGIFLFYTSPRPPD